MMDARKSRRRFWFKMAFVVLVTAVSYAIAYRTVVQPIRFSTMRGDQIISESAPLYSEHPFAQMVLLYGFAPANWIDRGLRVETWESKTLVSLPAGTAPIFGTMPDFSDFANGPPPSVKSP